MNNLKVNNLGSKRDMRKELGFGAFFYVLIIMLSIVFFVNGKHSSASSDVVRGVHLKENAEVWSSDVCLGDIVEDAWVSSRCSLEGTACCISKIDSTHTKKMTRVEIKNALEKIKIRNIIFLIAEDSRPEEITITQTRRPLSTEELHARVKEKLQKSLSTQGEDLIYKITSLKFPVRVYVGLEENPVWDVVLPHEISESLQFSVVVGEEKKIAGWGVAQLEAECKAIVAKRTIRPGEALTDNDISLSATRINVLSGTNKGIKSPEELVGQRARMTIRQGQVVNYSMIEKIPLIKSGDYVSLVLKSDGLKITTKGISQGVGAVGDTIGVQVSRFNKVFRGKILEDKTVEVWF